MKNHSDTRWDFMSRTGSESIALYVVKSFSFYEPNSKLYENRNEHFFYWSMVPAEK
jgi:hypothetical protein